MADQVNNNDKKGDSTDNEVDLDRLGLFNYLGHFISQGIKKRPVHIYCSNSIHHVNPRSKESGTEGS